MLAATVEFIFHLTPKFTDRGDIMRVYIKIDSKNRITDINSEIFISDVSGWVEIDNGDGDRFAHAQGNYLPMPLLDDNGVYRYKYINGEISECSADEMTADLPVPEPAPPSNAELATAIAELAEVIYNG